jgi:hypothetical protein
MTMTRCAASLVWICVLSAAMAAGTTQPQPRASTVAAASDDAARAQFDAADALRDGQRCDEAIAAYEDVAVTHPRTAWAGRAELGIARCLVRLGRARDAMPHLQRLRWQASALPAADVDQALRWNSALARLYLRAPSDPLFTYGGSALGTTARPRDVVALASVASSGASSAGSSSGQVAVLTENAFVLYEPDGRLAQSFPVQNPRALLVSASGAPRVMTRNGLYAARDGREAIVPLRAGTQVVDEVMVACVGKGGEILIVNRKARAIQRFSADGQFVGAFAAGTYSRLAANERGDVAALDRESKAVTLFDAQGKPGARVPARGEGYQLEAPIDVALDPFGHLYVLDRDRASVTIFTPDGKLFGSLASPASGEGAFGEPSALAIDSTGRLLIYDDRLHRVVIYQ